jgi:hypothetical protein
MVLVCVVCYKAILNAKTRSISVRSVETGVDVVQLHEWISDDREAA